MNSVPCLVEKFTVVAGNREARVEHPLRGHAAQTDNDFGADQLKLLAQPRHARGGFFRQRVAVLRRAAFDDIGNIDVFVTAQVDGLQIVVQPTAALAHKGKTLLVLVGTGALAYEHDLGVCGTLAKGRHCGASRTGRSGGRPGIPVAMLAVP